MNKVFTLFKKDVLLEFRQQHAFYGILLYIASTIFVLYLTTGQPEAVIWNAMFWIIQLFVCVNGVAKSFMQESKGRMLYFFSITDPVSFIISKLLYNVLLMFVMTFISLILFTILLGNPAYSFFKFLLIAFFGTFSISLVFTLMAAIAAKAQQNAALMAILGFPLIIPQLLLLIKLSKSVFGEVYRDSAIFQITFLLIGFDIMVIALSVILFPFLWKE